MSNIILKNVNFGYNKDQLVVEDVNINIKSGENVAILGQNGAGKTTTVKMMNGLLKPTTGDVIIGDDMNTKNYTTAQISKYVGYVFQNPDDQIFHSTVEGEVRFGTKNMNISQEEKDDLVEKALIITNLIKYRDENPFNLPLSTRKFVTIAAVIAMNTDVLVFDEPTAGQDIEGNLLLSDILKKLHASGKTVITISHDMEFVVSNFSRIIVMANKRVVKEGTPKEIFYDEETLRKSMLKLPYISRVYKKLGIDGEPLILDEMVQLIKENYNEQ